MPSLLPQFHDFFNPILAALRALGGSARPREVYSWIADSMQLNDAQLSEQNQDGTSRFENRVAWARFFLAKSGYIDSSRRGVWALTEQARSIEVFSQEKVQTVVREVQAKSGQRTLPEQSEGVEQDTSAENVDRSTPEESATNYREAVIEIVRDLPPEGFERICQRLLRESGFQSVKVIGRTGDEGIDGIGVLNVNPFVSFKVLFQCKRYTGTVGAPQIRDFRGAMSGRADKGLVITTGTFSADARREAVRDGVPPIELVDGEKLIDLLEELELGLVPRTTYDVDEGFFAEFK